LSAASSDPDKSQRKMEWGVKIVWRRKKKKSFCNNKKQKHIFGCLGSVLSCKNEYIIFKETLTNTTVKKLMVKESLALKSVIFNI
jgi:hypothetical protein